MRNATDDVQNRTPRTQELFKALRILDEVQKQGRVVPTSRKYAPPDGVVPIKDFEMAPHLEPTPDRPLLNLLTIGQNQLEAILRATLQKYSCKVEFGHGLVSLVQDAGGVDATILNQEGQEETQRFDFLVGTDGARGAVQKQLGLSFLGESRPSIHFVVADVHAEGIDADYWHMWEDLQANKLFLRPTGTPTLFGLIMILSDYPVLNNDHDLLKKAVADISGRVDFKILDVDWSTG
ncbi:FAD binding domain-containing protein [Mycena sp. CBHHK59/15]|nr:FAD binding domain-containing protein [Mycena sp. CBHHK59/15]